MDFSANDEFTNGELSTSELDTISGGVFTIPLHPGHGPVVLPQGGVPSHGQGGDIDRPHPGEPTLSLF
jgi:hypothetical protein